MANSICHTLPFFFSFSLTGQTEILSTETSDFLKQILILKAFTCYSVFKVISESKMTRKLH